MFAVIGLGNPGERYANTRHNVGFIAALAVATVANGAANRWQTKGDVLFSRLEISGHDTLVIMPQAFMNLSGQASRPLLAFYKVEPRDVIVIHDELDLPPGALKLKRGGGDAGHRGVKDLITHLGSSEFIRVRVGVGHPRSVNETASEGGREASRVAQDVSSWVLSVPPVGERELIQAAARKAAEAVRTIISNGFADAQQKFNRNSSLS